MVLSDRDGRGLRFSIFGVCCGISAGVITFSSPPFAIMPALLVGGSVSMTADSGFCIGNLVVPRVLPLKPKLDFAMVDVPLLSPKGLVVIGQPFLLVMVERGMPLDTLADSS